MDEKALIDQQRVTNIYIYICMYTPFDRKADEDHEYHFPAKFHQRVKICLPTSSLLT